MVAEWTEKFIFRVDAKYNTHDEFVGAGIWRDYPDLSYIIEMNAPGQYAERRLVSGVKIDAIRVYTHNFEKNAFGDLLITLSAKEMAALLCIQKYPYRRKLRSANLIEEPNWNYIQQQSRTFAEECEKLPKAHRISLNMRV